jgi:predicted dehydrogenase
MFAILGSGFGLYGYLPALASSGEGIVLPERYRSRFQLRRELAQFASAVQWAKDEMEALDCADGAVLALRPEDQVECIQHCLARGHLTRLLLEKPLAPAPDAAARTLEDLKRVCKTFRIGYTFPYTSWGGQLRRILSQSKGDCLSSQWTFLAYHFRHRLRSWKQYRSQGGGVIRFYGIQLIAMLVEWNYQNVTFSQTAGMSSDEDERWSATFTGPDVPPCNVSIDARFPTDQFRLVIERTGKFDQVLADGADPFGEAAGEAIDGLDRRVPILAQIYRSLSDDHFDWYEHYARVNELWQKVETKNEFVAINAVDSEATRAEIEGKV